MDALSATKTPPSHRPPRQQRPYTSRKKQCPAHRIEPTLGAGGDEEAARFGGEDGVQGGVDDGHAHERGGQYPKLQGHVAAGCGELRQEGHEEHDAFRESLKNPLRQPTTGKAVEGR